MTTQQQETKQADDEDVLILKRVPDVLKASIGESSKRERHIGCYHYSDVAGMGVVACARLYAGLDKEEDFPRYLARRGLVLEEMGLAALPEHQKQPEVLCSMDGYQIVLHPDGVTLDTDGDPVLLECASQLSAEDEDKEEVKLDQVLTAAGGVNAGGTLTTRHGVPVPGKVKEVRIQLLGLWEGAEIPYTEIESMAAERFKWLREKTARVHELAHQMARLESGEGSALEAVDIIEAKDRALATAHEWDERYPSQARFQPEIAPILDGERGEEADRAVEAYAAWKDAEKAWKEQHKPRWEATLDLDTLKSVGAPGGGKITLRKRDVQEVDPEVYEKLEGPSMEDKVASLIAQVEADTKALREQYEAARREHPHATQIPELQAEIEKAREAATVTRQVPNGILVTRPKGKKGAGA